MSANRAALNIAIGKLVPGSVVISGGLSTGSR